MYQIYFFLYFFLYLYDIGLHLKLSSHQLFNYDLCSVQMNIAIFFKVKLDLNQYGRHLTISPAFPGIVERDIRLNGGAASYILGNENDLAYNDVDLIFGVDLGSNNEMLREFPLHSHLPSGNYLHSPVNRPCIQPK